MFKMIPWAKLVPSRKSKARSTIQPIRERTKRRYESSRRSLPRFYAIGYRIEDGEKRHVIRDMGKTFRHIAEHEARRVFRREKIAFEGVYPARGQP